MSVYDLYQSYLNQLQPAAPAASSNVLDPSYLLYLQQQRGGDGGGQDNDPTKDTTPTANLGINSLSDAYSKMSDYFSPYGMVGGVLGGIPGAFAGRAIGNLISNIQNPNTTMFGQPTREYQEKLQRTAQQINQNKQYFSGGDSGGGHPGGAAAAAGAAAQAADDRAAGAGGY